MKINFLGKSYLIPDKSFLVSHYGKNWHIKKKYSYSEGLSKGAYKSLK